MIHLQDLLAVTGGKIHGPVFADTFVDFCYDTRLLKPGELFLAVVTAKGDGHDYVLEAARVVLIGEQGRRRITAEEVADRLGTINYEVVSEILARVPRIV